MAVTLRPWGRCSSARRTGHPLPVPSLSLCLPANLQEPGYLMPARSRPPMQPSLASPPNLGLGSGGLPYSPASLQLQHIAYNTLCLTRPVSTEHTRSQRLGPNTAHYAGHRAVVRTFQVPLASSSEGEGGRMKGGVRGGSRPGSHLTSPVRRLLRSCSCRFTPWLNNRCAPGM